jgi:hypothetical protein
MSAAIADMWRIGWKRKENVMRLSAHLDNESNLVICQEEIEINYRNNMNTGCNGNSKNLL